METALSGEMRPSKYVYLVYRAEELRDGYLSSQKSATKIDAESGFSYTPLHKFAAFSDIPDRMRHGLIGEEAKLYLIDFKSVTVITQGGDRVTDIDSLEDDSPAALLKKLHRRLND